MNTTINFEINCGILFYMARRKLDERNVRKLYKNSGGSIQVTLPIEVVRRLKWRDGQKVVVDQVGKSIVIKDWKV